jgi:hypothetical protein
MSLINDALKKAQRQRTNNPFGVEPPMPGGGGRVAKRGKAMQSQSIMLIVAGSAVLVVLSVVVTVFLVNGKHTPKPSAAVAQTVAPTAPIAAVAEPLPALILPKIELPATLTPAPTPAPVATPTRMETASVERPPMSASRAPTEVKSEPKPVTPTLKPTADERVNVFLDALRITGIRSSGSDSRVMMNEHVYRLNDIVDRSLGLRLTTVASDHLTFTDPSGANYDKNF